MAREDWGTVTEDYWFTRWEHVPVSVEIEERTGEDNPANVELRHGFERLALNAGEAEDVAEWLIEAVKEIRKRGKKNAPRPD